MRVDVRLENFHWIRERAGLDAKTLVRRFPKYAEWEAGTAQPTLKQLERLASAVHAPLGYFFLPKPMDEPIPMRDFRTVGSVALRRPSPDLLDTIYLCQQRQDWYREFARMEGEETLAFVGSANIEADVEVVAATIRETLDLDLEERRALPTWTEALRCIIQATDTLGVLVMVSGIVRSNTHRRLDPREFRGFTLADDLAPLIFINGADSKAAQMFTLAHELAHLWLGQSALSDTTTDALPAHEVEAWCNRVAAEFLVPLAVLQEDYRPEERLSDALARLARRFKVSTLVILRRIYDAGELTRDRFREAYRAELERLNAAPRGGGGNFYSTETVRVGDRFAHALAASTLEGRTSFTEAFQMLGIRKIHTFDEWVRRLGLTV